MRRVCLWPGVRRAGPQGQAHRSRRASGAAGAALDLVRHDSASDRAVALSCGVCPVALSCPHFPDELALPLGRRLLRPEAKYGRGLPAPQYSWPATGRPWVSAGVHRCRWRLSLTSSLGRSRSGRERLLSRHTLSKSAQVGPAKVKGARDLGRLFRVVCVERLGAYLSETRNET
jgi:hypothetical protein